MWENVESSAVREAPSRTRIAPPKPCRGERVAGVDEPEATDCVMVTDSSSSMVPSPEARRAEPPNSVGAVNAPEMVRLEMRTDAPDSIFHSICPESAETDDFGSH